MSESGRQPSQVVALLLVALAMVVVPLGWRAVNAAWAPPLADLPPSYLPALEARRERLPYDTWHVEGLQMMQPSYVVIGDSMGGRIDPYVLDDLSGGRVAPLLWNATGSAFWYLAFKNYVVRSGIRPRLVFIFFRDTNLTDPLWRATDAQRETLDYAALDDEPELNAVMAARMAGPWFRAHAMADSVYGFGRARGWLEPALTRWLSRVVAGRPNGDRLLADVNAAFELDRLRPISQADMVAAEELDTDFATGVETSVLPLLLSLAREEGLRLAFVRVLRRTEDGRIRQQSEALTRYVAALREYVEAGGGILFDDRDDPAMATVGYDDGDHIRRDQQARYTELFWERLSRLPQ